MRAKLNGLKSCTFNSSSVVVDVQNAFFSHVSLVIAELEPFEFVKKMLGVDFQGLNSMSVLSLQGCDHDRVWGYFCHLQCQF